MKTYKLRYIYNNGNAVETHLFRCNKNVDGQFSEDSSRNLPLDVQLIIRKLGVNYWPNNTIEIYPVDIKDIQL